MASIDRYIYAAENGTLDFEIEELDQTTRYNDFVITAIRTCWGMSLDKLKTDFGTRLYDYCLRMARPHIEQGTLQITDGTLRLTEQGIFVSDGIMSDMLWVE